MNRRVQDPKEFFQLSPDGKRATLHLNDTALVGKIVRLLAFLDNGSKTQGAYEARAAVTCGIRRAVNNELQRVDPRLKRRELQNRAACEVSAREGARAAMARRVEEAAAYVSPENVVIFNIARHEVRRS